MIASMDTNITRER